MSLVELLLLAVGLAMDAFAVSVCGSMVLTPDNRLRGALRFGSWFGAFQFLMPVIGYFGAVSFRDYITEYDHWLAFFLLLYLGNLNLVLFFLLLYNHSFAIPIHLFLIVFLLH